DQGNDLFTPAEDILDLADSLAVAHDIELLEIVHCQPFVRDVGAIVVELSQLGEVDILRNRRSGGQQGPRHQTLGRMHCGAPLVHVVSPNEIRHVLCKPRAIHPIERMKSPASAIARSISAMSSDVASSIASSSVSSAPIARAFRLCRKNSTWSWKSSRTGNIAASARRIAAMTSPYRSRVSVSSR